jgi:hypothetical protein
MEMKHIRALFVGMALLSVLAFLSCDVANSAKPEASADPISHPVATPTATGSISLGIGNGSRTVRPADVAAYTVVNYDVSGVGPGMATFSDANLTASTYTRTGLAAGSWTVTVNGKNSGGHVIYSTAVNLDILSGQTASATVVLARAAGNGSIDINVDWLVAADYAAVAGILTPVGGGTVQNLTLSISGGTHLDVVSTQQAGDYELLLTFNGGTVPEKTIFQIVQVYEGYTSTGDFDITVNLPAASPETWSYTAAAPVYALNVPANSQQAITISGAAGRSVYLVKANAASSAAASGTNGSASTGLMKVPYSASLIPAEPEYIPVTGKVDRREHKAAAEFNANPPIVSEPSRKTLPGLERTDATSYGPVDPLLTVGTSTKNFWVENALGAWISITATLRAAGQYNYVWVANDNYGASSAANNDNLITTAQAQALCDKFDGTSPAYNDGIFKNVTNIFGYEYGGGVGGLGGRDEDQHIAILVYDIYYDYTSTQSGGVLGYFWGKDYYSQAQLDSWYGTGALETNYNEMFYVDSHFTDRFPNTIVSTLAHEYQHMINFNEKTLGGAGSSNPWFNEMCSMVAEDLVAANIGLNPLTDGAIDRMNEFNYHYAESGVSDWLSGNDVLKSYASAFAFGAYLERNYGGAPLFKAILANNTVNEASISAALLSLGYTDTFSDAFRHYGEALVFTTSAPSGSSVKQLNRDQTDTIGSIEYTARAFDLLDFQQRNLASGYVAGAFGPRVYAPGAVLELRPFGTSIHSQASWQALAGNLTVTVQAPSDPDVALYLMVK